MDLGQVGRAARPVPSLVVYAPGGAVVLSLPEGTDLVIGRTDEADVVVADRSLSRVHARIRASGENITVQDLGSKNGTKINGEAISSASLGAGDELTLGRVAAVLLQPESASRWVDGKSQRGQTGPIIESPAMIALYENVDRFATSGMPVLIQGETGAGKEVVARMLHDRSARREKPMACINCGAIPAQLVEDTLFGHERGAFTGATHRQAGIFESASGGTVFLDEIGELPAPAQAALLRVLETKRLTRVGSPLEIEVDVRIVAATNRNLEEMCQQGTFRWDLLYRLNAVTLKIPPLRQRPEEILPLARHFLAQLDGKSPHRISDSAARCLTEYRWPGNVRELANVVQRAAVMAKTDAIDLEDLPERLRSEDSQESGDVEPLEIGRLAPAPPPEEPDEEEALDFKSQMQQAEITIIVRALEKTGWNQTEAAARLQMPLRTLVHKIKKLEIKDLVSKKRAEARK